MAGPMVGPILERLDGLDLVPTYWEPDGEFPDHEPNPLLPENREFIIAQGARRGRRPRHRLGRRRRPLLLHRRRPASSCPATSSPRCWPSRSCEKRPGADILYDVRASRAVPTPSSAAGGRALVNRVGHAFFKTRMRDEGGAFGGEVSGHYYFADFYNADSGTIPALLILELLSPEGRDAVRAARAATARSTSSPARSTPRSPTRPAKMDADRGALRRRADQRELDGISVDYDDWHFNVRPSNTEPLLRLNLEASSPQADMEAGATRCCASSARDPHALRSRRRSWSAGSTAT